MFNQVSILRITIWQCTKNARNKRVGKGLQIRTKNFIIKKHPTIIFIGLFTIYRDCGHHVKHLLQNLFYILHLLDCYVMYKHSYIANNSSLGDYSLFELHQILVGTAVYVTSDVDDEDSLSSSLFCPLVHVGVGGGGCVLFTSCAICLLSILWLLFVYIM